MDDKRTQTLEEYRKKTSAIIMSMFKVLARARRKTDDLKYRRTLEKIQKSTQAGVV